MRFLSTAIGGLEWYDNAICIALTDVISRVFFPDFDVSARFMLYLTSIAVGYLGRPLGAFVLGIYSDRINRMRAAFFGFAAMVIASLCISFLPTYAQVGIYAPILFVFFRFVQGMAIGGNYAVAVATVEKVHKSERYTSSSFVSVGITLGFLFGSFAASTLSYFFNQEFLLQFGWRIGLWSSALLSIPVLMMFKNVDMKTKHKLPAQAKPEKLELKMIAKVFVLFLLDMVPFYLLFTFLPNYKVMFLGQSSATIWFYNTLAMLVIAVCTPFFGKLADAYGAIKCLKTCAFGFVIASFFSPWNSPVWTMILAVIISICYGSLYGFIPLVFPQTIRARASGVLFNITASISIGVTPIIAAYLASLNFAYVGMFLGAVCMIVWMVLNTLAQER